MLSHTVPNTDLPVVERRQSICRNCPDPQPRADPFSVTEGNGVRVIGYRCAVCQYVWQVNATSEPSQTIGLES